MQYTSNSGSFGEDLFLRLFSETFGAEKAGYLYSQYPFYDIYQNNRYADFALVNGGQRIAIKIEQLILSPMQTLRGHDAPQPHTVVAMDKSV